MYKIAQRCPSASRRKDSMQIDNVSQLSVRCFKCGSFGHRGAECWKRTEANPNGHFEKCWICGCLGHIAVECKEKTVTCFSCGARGHKQENCVSAMANCWNCGEKGHIKRTCPRKRLGMCFYCHRVGHHSKDCKQKACYYCSSKDHLLTQCPHKEPRGINRRPRRQNVEIRTDDDLVRPFSFPLMLQTGFNLSSHEQNDNLTTIKTNANSSRYPMPIRSNSSPLPLSVPFTPREQNNRSWHSFDDLSHYSSLEQLKNLRPSRQVQQSITPRQGDFPVDVLGPLYRPEDSPPLATAGTIRTNSVPALPSEDDVWSSAVFREAHNKFAKDEDPMPLASYAGPGLSTVFGKLDVSEKKEQLDTENKNAVQSESPPSVLSSASPVVSEVSNNTCQSLNSKSAEDIMVTTEEDPDFESTSILKPSEPTKKEGNVLVVSEVSNYTSLALNSKKAEVAMVRNEEDPNLESKPLSEPPEPSNKEDFLEELKIELADMLNEISLVTMQIAKEQEVVSALKTKFTLQQSPNRCQSCIDRLKAFDSCKNCVNSRGSFSRSREKRKHVNFGIVK